MKQYIVTGMTCAACQAHVEKAVRELKDVDSVSVSLLTNSMRVEGNASASEVIQAVEKAGYGAHVQGEEKQSSSDLEDALVDHETPKLKKICFWLYLADIEKNHVTRKCWLSVPRSTYTA